MSVPFLGRILRKPAPGGWDHCARQEVASLSSHRPIWAYILDRELTEVAGMVQAFQQMDAVQQEVLRQQLQKIR